MKNNRIFAIGAFLISIGFVNAQTTIYDANRWMESDLNGTARFVGMGGAMGALGGDITTMGTNPAGIGIYRSNDVMVSFGFENNGAKAIGGLDVNKSYGSFDNAGFVFSTKIGNSTALRYANFGFNYRKIKSFDKNMLMGGVFNTSQTIQMADMLNLDPSGRFDPWVENALESKDAFQNPDLSWLGLMGYNAHLVNPEYGDPVGENGEKPFNGYFPHFVQGDAVTQSYRSKESGGTHSFDLNGALNFYDRFYVGATLGLYSVNYDRTSEYSEDFKDKDGKGHGGYTLGNEFWVNGNGIDFKLGFLFRPIESSSFRIGGAIHTPTFYSLTERNTAYIDYDLNENLRGYTRPYDANGRDTEGEYDYDLITPWKFNLSMGYTIGSSVALGVEYEYCDRTSARMKDTDGRELGQVEDIKAMMKAVHTIRAGAEFKLMPEFSFRLGYNHITSPMKSDAFKYLPVNSIRTDTEFSNLGAINNYTFGCGYRGESFYVDMAYLFNTYNETFYAFNNLDLPGTKITNSNHKVLLTLGLRF